MLFKPFVYDNANQTIPVSIQRMTCQDADVTNSSPVWQTSWTNEYLQDVRFEKYSAKVNEKLIALGAYEILENALIVHLAYTEAHPASNPTLDGGTPEYRGIGLAYGIKLSIDHGLAGDVVLEAKTTELARHYEKDFGAVSLPSFESSAPRY